MTPTTGTGARGRGLDRAILFDLDGTLLDLDIDDFLPRYLKALAPYVAPVVAPAASPEEFVHQLLAATEAMMQVRDPTRTNQEVFEAEFFARLPVDRDRMAEVVRRFYAEEFPKLAPARPKGAGLAPGPHDARATVLEALARGYRIALATQPVYPMAAIRERMRWAGVDDLPWDLVTSYEHMHATKPDPAYFLEIAERLGCPPERCWMVGDDPHRDLPARDVGMRVFWVVPDGPGAPGAPAGTRGPDPAGRTDTADVLAAGRADAWGSLEDFRALLRALPG